jgi:glycosyltransferase involved in cell wall biosynthesis
MACGLPIVTTNMCIAGLELVKNGENGFITSTEDVNEVASRINGMLNDMNLLDKMREKSIQKIKYYTIENMAKIHYQFLENIREKMKETNM